MRENMNDQDTSGILSIVAAFAIGSLIGASVALLMAPQPGEQTRAMIADNASDLKDKALNAVDDTRERAGKAADNLSKKGKSKAAELKGRAKDKIDDTKDKADEQLKAAKKSMGY